jgi:hypothetical protein
MDRHVHQYRYTDIELYADEHLDGNVDRDAY